MTRASTRPSAVQTTTVRAASSWKVYLSTSHGGRRTYDPDEIDDFFVIDGEFGYYLIPVPAVGGLQAVHLGAYEEYRLPTQLLPAARGRTLTRAADMV